ncbi:MAG: hypothetical protein WKG01_05570 [Kofleriaceae bacterium]
MVRPFHAFVDHRGCNEWDGLIASLVIAPAVDDTCMEPISGACPSLEHQVRVEKIAQDSAKQQGQQAVDLIEQATPPVGPDGQGRHVNRYA